MDWWPWLFFLVLAPPAAAIDHSQHEKALQLLLLKLGGKCKALRYRPQDIAMFPPPCPSSFPEFTPLSPLRLTWRAEDIG
jgi:hypothetical protein